MKYRIRETTYADGSLSWMAQQKLCFIWWDMHPDEYRSNSGKLSAQEAIEHDRRKALSREVSNVEYI